MLHDLNTEFIRDGRSVEDFECGIDSAVNETAGGLLKSIGEEKRTAVIKSVSEIDRNSAVGCDEESGRKILNVLELEIEMVIREGRERASNDVDGGRNVGGREYGHDLRVSIQTSKECDHCVKGI